MDHSPTVHVPVLAAEVLELLAIQPGQTVLDGTLGGGGHTRLFVEHVEPGGRVVAVDRDPAAVKAAETSLAGLPVHVACASYAELPEILDVINIPHADAVLLDLGLSSDQLTDFERGFSYEADGTLDMRYDPTQGEPAWHLLDRLSAEHLAAIIFEYGEERFSRRIAREIVARRRQAPIRTACDLAQLVRRCVPRSKHHRIDPATRTFQALRIAVNRELDELKTGLDRIPDRILPGGRIAVISFHSLEDRIVKRAFRSDERLSVITRKTVRPTDEEVARNRRSRSARMRVAQRV